VKSTHYENALVFDSIENDMPFILESAVFLLIAIIGMADSRRCNKPIEAIFEPAVIAASLIFSPSIDGIVNDLCPITPG
jgi:hypothetical protein